VGRYVNPGNEQFARILKKKYVDKTGIISLFDDTLESEKSLVMVSRPRRFGKSYAAKVLAAFYSCGCDSRELFEGWEVSRADGWDAHLNRYNVIFLDMTGIIRASGTAELVTTMDALLVSELRGVVADAGSNAAGKGDALTSALWDVVEATGHKFVFVIDEWDAPYRLAKGNVAAQDSYAEWLRSLFKDATFTPHVVAGTYMTGILPIKKYNHQSAVSDFDEYTMLDPAKYSPYVGFTDEEVKGLCEEYGMDLDDMRRWYDGYRLRYRKDWGVGSRPRFEWQELDIYAPYSLMRACERGKTGSYWPSTESFRSLCDYVDMDFEGLQGDVLRAVAGGALRVDTGGFQNDLASIRSKDDVLTLLCHLGYLAYDSEFERMYVPNEEVRGELRRAVAGSSHKEVARIVRESIQLVSDVLAMDDQAVATGIQRAHDATCTPLFYNDEQSLRAVVRSALIAAVDDWARVEELPSGHGYADVVYVPRRGSSRPGLIVELKWDKPITDAIDQIRERGYADFLRDLGVPVLLVCVTYDTKTKKHHCHIEPWKS
jgi:hypothetical protein